MDLRQLRYFLTIAEEGSVAAASRRLHIAQPALSRHMRALEEQIGTELFVRNTRGVTLTDAGVELIACATRAIDSVRDLTDRMASFKMGLSGELNLGIVSNYSWLPILRRVFDKLADIGPGLRVHLQPQMSVDQLENLRKGRLDVGILTWRPKLDPGFQGFPVYHDRWAVVVPRSIASRYAAERAHLLSEFRRESFVMFPRECSPSTFDAVSNLFHGASFAPTLKHTAADMSTMLGLVISGIGCAIVPESYRRHVSDDVTVFSLEDAGTEFDLELVWRRDSSNVLLTRFIEAARAALSENIEAKS
ncbi:LysR family transcriptional regulator [Paraburkholderia sp. Tr-20389]|uniref:LysR family transcriptional regulator n=1 Tax=Paraburkholderia sp. Tr-20389 TaxID=2703903 RepID=UPI0019821E4B|nr:LysR family transcriptional regulator [Paraburkholderia sp. Tr-20389]MBN3754378.1 LysR family transcriptional regulator [Paraburkholderia sp. Tr-20389]